MAGPAPSPETVVAIKKKATGEDNNQVKELLSQFASFSASEQENARPSFVKNVFPLVFRDKVFVQGSSDYELQRQIPWSMDCWLSPLIIITPLTSQHVAAALSLCVFFRTKFSVRGGGRLNHPGANSNDGGVVISLVEFNQLQLSTDKRTAYIGVGLRWLDVYKALEPHGLAIAGGRVPKVGVPGLILGAGISFQNSQYGIGAMGVVNYEIVLADSRIINANAHENPDLFWALKGGGPNFGSSNPLTSLSPFSARQAPSNNSSHTRNRNETEMLTVPNHIWCKARVYPLTAYDSLIASLMQYHDAIESNDKATLIWYSNDTAILLVLVYCSPDFESADGKNSSAPAPAVFGPFLDMPSLQSLVAQGVRTVYDLAQGIADVVSTEAKLYEFRTMSSHPSLKLYKAIDQARAEQTASLYDVEGIPITAVFQPMSSLAMQKSADSPLGLDPVGQQWFLAMGECKHSTDEARVRDAIKKIVDIAESTAREDVVWLRYKYTNYAARDQDALGSYGAKNVERLKEIASRYDPKSVFQDLQGRLDG
ncbi:hypothetical protein BDV10DRAFT_202734 [Aspergillus recurvatus]